jgi:hypothetical protein
MNSKIITVNIILSRKYLITIGIWVIIIFASLSLSFFLPKEKEIFSFIFFCLAMPLIFFNGLGKKRYNDKIKIKLDYDMWEFIVFKKEHEEKYKLNDIKSYSIHESKNGTSVGLSFKSKISNLENFRFGMLYKKLTADQTDTEEVVQSFQSMIKDYNKTVDIEKQIILTETFAESVYGLISVYVLSGLIILDIVLQIAYHRLSTLPYSLLIGIGALLSIVGTRFKDRKRRNR